jgi:transcription antitermination factor NusG
MPLTLLHPSAHPARHDPRDLASVPRWYACYTRARHEKRVHGLLERKGMESYLPLMPRESQWADRRKTVLWPLFPGYVFARFSLRDMHEVVVTPGLATILKLNGLPVPIPDGELDNVRLLVSAAGRAGIEPEPLQPLVQPGHWVRVEDGPFTGLEGQVVQRRGRTRVRVELRATGHAVEVDIDERALRLADAPVWGVAALSAA